MMKQTIKNDSCVRYLWVLVPSYQYMQWLHEQKIRKLFLIYLNMSLDEESESECIEMNFFFLVLNVTVSAVCSCDSVSICKIRFALFRPA